MHRPFVPDVEEKRNRIFSLFESEGYNALVIGRQDNFAWYTGGGNNRVVISSEAGFGLLVLMRERTFLVAQIMDGPRILEEELAGLNVEPVLSRWYEPSREETAAKLVQGMRTLSDVPLPTAECDPQKVYDLHYPLTRFEMEKYRRLGATTDHILRKTADWIRPGMRERDVEAFLLYEYAKENMIADVLLVGSDDRIGRYRHPNPTDREIGKLVLLHPAVRCGGLHANVTRMVYFGDRVPDDVRNRFDAACAVEAAAVSMCVPGISFADILESEKRTYRERGFPEEWRNHYQGGITGYLLCDPTLCLRPGALVRPNQAFDWFITITGAKVEELTLSAEEGPRVVSAAGAWPVREIESGGATVPLPDILLR